MYIVVFINVGTLIKSYTTLTANPNIKIFLEFHVSSSIKNHQSFSPFLVHYSVSTFSASDWIPGFYFIFCVTFSTDIYHRLLLWGLNILLGIHCQSLKSQAQILNISKGLLTNPTSPYFSQRKIKRCQFLICIFSKTMRRSKGQNRKQRNVSTYPNWRQY